MFAQVGLWVLVCVEAGGANSCGQKPRTVCSKVSETERSFKPFCWAKKTKHDSEKRSRTFSCMPVHLCVYLNVCMCVRVCTLIRSWAC